MKSINYRQKSLANVSGARQAEQSSPKTIFNLHSKKVRNLRLIAKTKNVSKKSSANLLLSILSETLLAKLQPALESVNLAADEYLYRAGDPVNYLYFPEAAVISELRIVQDGRIIETAMVGCEGLVGLSESFSNAPTGNWTQVLVAGSALKIRADVFKAELDESRELQTISFDYLARYINQLSQRSSCQSFHSIQQRFCGWLMMLVKRSSLFKIRLTQEQIARNLGVHRPSLSTIAKDLQDGGLIKYRRGNFSITDAFKVEQLACECHR